MLAMLFAVTRWRMARPDSATRSDCDATSSNTVDPFVSGESADPWRRESGPCSPGQFGTGERLLRVSGGLAYRDAERGGHRQPALERALVGHVGEVGRAAPGDAAVRAGRCGHRVGVELRVQAVLEQRERLGAQLGDARLGDPSSAAIPALGPPPRKDPPTPSL